ncbi:unnamed protein product [Caenorhabditis bovis]|uniref:Ion transport domain-containing protein n=1 Tax=Caenorhabditis bovis TaxID=2654633 RepID=A0A8S1F3Z6_9PELO|nr:unnamed protein product [Caenorhabditis bovis]
MLFTALCTFLLTGHIFEILRQFKHESEWRRFGYPLLVMMFIRIRVDPSMPYLEFFYNAINDAFLLTIFDIVARILQQFYEFVKVCTCSSDLAGRHRTARNDEFLPDHQSIAKKNARFM